MSVGNHQVIDTHIHFSPRVLVQDALDSLKSPTDKQTRYTQGVPSYTVHGLLHDLDVHLQMMDYSGMDVAVLSSGEGMSGDLAKCRVVNDTLHEQTPKYKGRIVGMAHTAPAQGKAALDELERAVKDLGLRGVVIPSTIDGKGLDEREFFPFYEKVQELNQFIFVHPALGCGTLGLQGFDRYDLFRTVGREFDLVIAVMRLVSGGVLDEFPRLKVIMSHFGGGITSLVGRIRDYQDKDFWGLAHDPIHGKTAKQPFDYYLSRLYFDTGGHFGDMTAVKAALLNIPVSQLLFGTDYPQEIRSKEQVKQFVQNLASMDLPEKDIHAILGGNAKAILDAAG